MIEYDVKNTPIVDLVNAIILFAVKNRASDIHLDPREDHLLVRIRIDGLLKDHTKIPKEYERNFVTRVKLISAMNITENRLPQDGAIKAKIGNYSLDMRVSSMPTNEGEKVVIRILDYTKSLEGIESLGFSEKNFIKIKKMMAVPNGIILVTGATGTGKSTTVYTMIQELNKEDTNIITVEDPIEMNIEGINQVQANSEIGLDFATVLRSILRQDPNIILIGEIRDSETAKIAVRASITGHLVLSTVHTNNSLSTIERLLDMDVERYLLSTALVGIVSQKLARKLCPHCKNTRITTHYEKHLFKKVLNKDVDEICTPGRCDKCINGYYERTAIQEVLLIDEHIRDIISRDNVDKEELRNLIYNSGVTTLLQDGLEKVADGITSFDEVVKLIQIEEGLDDDYKFDLINKIKINKEEEEKGLANN
ncbi:MAG: GspE/PulE family protein [Bacilli bacterium]